MPHIRVFFCFQLNAGILKAVEIRMDIEVGIDLECTILPDDQLVEPDDGKSTPQAVNDSLCYNTKNYVFCSANQVIYRIVLVYSVSKMF